ncbi:hypothetical protein [Streptomyces viridosporus]|uniref:hypothetical protein n=1 Tax=Streptomyces viridosporus TaxID=67581 RepID=UPI003703203C
MGDGTTGGPRPVGPALDRPGPRPGRRYAEPVGGPLDGLLLEVTGFTPDEVDTDAALATELGQFGADGRTVYGPRSGEADRFDWTGITP